MERTRRRSSLLLGIVVVLFVAQLGHSRGLIGETEAVWTDPEHTSASVTSGSWTTTGYGLGIAAKVVSAGGIRIIGGSPPPWVGASGSRDASSAPTPGTPGRTVGAGTGPYDSVSGVGVNRLRMGGASNFGGAVGATGCGSYSVGVSSPTYCASSPGEATASATVSSMYLGGSVLQVLGPLITTTIVAISGASQALSAAVTCNLVLGTSAVTQKPTAGTPSTGFGTISIGGTPVAVPDTGSATVVPNGTISQSGVGYSNIRLESTSSSGGAEGFARLKLTGSVSLLGLGLLPLTFDVDLVYVRCGPGAAPSALSATSALARAAVGPEESMAEITPTETTTTETTATETTTTELPTTTQEAAAATTPDATTTTDAPVETVEPPVDTVEPPVDTVEPPVDTVDPPLDTAEPTPPESATVFTGPSEGNVETLTFDGDVVCSAPAGSDYTGTVELSCSDGSSIGAVGSALTPGGVAQATVEGVWAPVLTLGGAAQPVVAATRG